MSGDAYCWVINIGMPFNSLVNDWATANHMARDIIVTCEMDHMTTCMHSDELNEFALNMDFMMHDTTEYRV